MLSRLKRLGASLHVRMLLLNAVVVLVPIAGLEFARIFERELLASLERDMRHQAVLVRRFLEARGDGRFDPSAEGIVQRAARDTRTRVRVLDASANVVLDSHRDGPPEGHEEPAPRHVPPLDVARRAPGPRWKPIAERAEVVDALGGMRSAFTRVRERRPSVFLFVSEPMFSPEGVVGVVYITRSTKPVMAELYRIRSGLQRVLAVAFVFTIGVTLWLTFSITRPLKRLSAVAERIAAGETGLTVPIAGTGEVRSLARAFATMTGRLQRRVNDMRDFAADVAHGFKSPLTSLRGAAELLAQGAADDPTARQRFLRNIELDAERLDRLVTRLLELSRIENSSDAPSIVNLRQLLETATERATTPDVHIELAWHAPEELSVRGRVADLMTALSNLLDNAVRHSPPGGCVEVSADWNAHDRGAMVRITVRDQGPGVASEVQSRLFERFFTTDAEQGTGLGLAIVRAVATNHGGSAELLTNERPGACFELRLPVWSEAARPPSARTDRA